jgi:ABC-2 type transport system ATP-binding protein
MSTTSVIEIEQLRKFYRGKHRGIDGVDLEVHQGEVFGFLGPNGAGKTTAIRILLDLIRADSGTARVFGLDVRKDSREIRRRTGYLPGELGLYESVLAREMVDYFAALRGSTHHGIVKELTDRLNIDLFRRIREYSKGNKQKLGILLAFLFDPELVILDEPTAGLDPLLQNQLYEFIVRQSQKGRTVFMSSHVLSEVDRVCDRVGIIREGKIVAVERIETLKAKMGQVLTVDFDPQFDVDDFREGDFNVPGVSKLQLAGRRLSLHVTGDYDDVLKALSRYRITKLLAEEYSLDDLFIEYYRKGDENDK